MYKFALVGSGGYIAGRHIKAIKETQCELDVALDKNGPGVLDQYFPFAEFFTTFEEFAEYIYLQKEAKKPIQYLTVCSPNYMHRSHIIYGLQNNMDIICEKPVALTVKDVELLQKVEDKCGKKVYNVLQLRLHPAVIALKNKIDREKSRDKYEINLSYVSFRSKWFFKSWNADPTMSGGIIMNFGIHFFDMLLWLLGKPEQIKLTEKSTMTCSGYLELEKARVKWLLSHDMNYIPEAIKMQKKTTYRSLKINGEEFDFSTISNDLHNVVYSQIIEQKKGISLEESKPVIRLAEQLNNLSVG